MKILTTENKAYELDHVPDFTEDVRFCVFDYSNPKECDYFFQPLMFMEEFTAPAIVLKIGKYRVQMPMNWSILVCDEEYSDMEVMPLTALNDRGYCTLAYNPLKHMVPRPQEIEVVNVFTDVNWFFPELNTGQFLVVPMDDGPCPDCVLFVKDTGKNTDIVDIGALFE